MRKNFTLLLLTVLFALVACDNNESSVDIDTTQKQQDAIVDGKIPLNRAISNANFVFRNTEALGHKNRKIKSVDVLTKTNSKIVSTRSSVQNEQDAPLAYVVNYENNEGFAILAADTKLPPVISIGDKGNFDTEGFVNFIQNNDTTRSNEEVNPAQMVQYAVVNNSLLLPPTGSGLLQAEGIDTTIILKCLPLVRTKWGQDAPYNYYAPPTTNSNGEVVKSAAGCVPIAGAQVITSLCFHHNWRPLRQLSDEYFINWSTLNKMIFAGIIDFEQDDNSTNALAAASLIRAIGEDIGANYGVTTGAYTEDLANTYEKLGMLDTSYGNESNGDYITTDSLFNMIISKNCPVNARTSRHTANGGLASHAFVLDGWLRLEYSMYGNITIPSLPSLPTRSENIQFKFDLVHANFGWYGYYDGYYLPAAFDLTEDKYNEYREINTGDIEAYVNIVYDLNVEYLIYKL